MNIIRRDAHKRIEEQVEWSKSGIGCHGWAKDCAIQAKRLLLLEKAYRYQKVYGVLLNLAYQLWRKDKKNYKKVTDKLPFVLGKASGLCKQAKKLN